MRSVAPETRPSGPALRADPATLAVLTPSPNLSRRERNYGSANGQKMGINTKAVIITISDSGAPALR